MFFHRIRIRHVQTLLVYQMGTFHLSKLRNLRKKLQTMEQNNHRKNIVQPTILLYILVLHSSDYGVPSIFHDIGKDVLRLGVYILAYRSSYSLINPSIILNRRRRWYYL